MTAGRGQSVLATITSLGLLLVSSAAGRPTAGPDEVTQRWAIDLGATVLTPSGYHVEIIGGDPSAIRDRLVTIGAPAADGWRIDVSHDAPAQGVGLKIPLNTQQGIRGVSGEMPASLRIKLRLIGSLGERRLNVELPSDARSNQPHSITIDTSKLSDTEWGWSEFEVPFFAASTVETVSLLLEGRGPGWLVLDRMTAADAPPTASMPSRAVVSKTLRKCMWVWTTNRILPSAEEQAALLEFATERDITDLFWQVVYRYVDDTIQMRWLAEQRKFNAAARAVGIRVHALDGNAEFVLPENHQRMHALMRALIAFNESAAPAERFSGVHLDNEPYLLPQWRSDETRGAVIDAYVQLNRTLGGLAREADLEYGVDIPFWWDARDADGNWRFATIVDDQPASILEALFPHVSNVGVMSYRERVCGGNGVLACCQSEFELGARHGVDVFAALETGVGPNVERGTTLGPYSAAHLEDQLATLERVLASQPGAAGWALHHYESIRTLLEKQP